MKKYEVETRNNNNLWVKVLNQNDKKETMTIGIASCENSGGKNSPPYLWYKNGFTSKIMETYICCNTYVHDSEGNCWGKYNPTEKLSDDGKRNVINFDWMLEDTEENRRKIIDECIRLFESAKGKSATELKIDHINEVAKERKEKVVFKLPEGWKESPRFTDPRGAITIIKENVPLFVKINGEAHKNPEYEQMLLVY